MPVNARAGSDAPAAGAEPDDAAVAGAAVVVVQGPATVDVEVVVGSEVVVVDVEVVDDEVDVVLELVVLELVVVELVVVELVVVEPVEATVVPAVVVVVGVQADDVGADVDVVEDVVLLVGSESVVLVVASTVAVSVALCRAVGFDIPRVTARLREAMARVTPARRVHWSIGMFDITSRFVARTHEPLPVAVYENIS